MPTIDEQRDLLLMQALFVSALSHDDPIVNAIKQSVHTGNLRNSAEPLTILKVQITWNRESNPRKRRNGFSCMSGERVGLGRIYVRVGGQLDFDARCDALAVDRSYVSDGRSHLMEFAVFLSDSQTDCRGKKQQQRTETVAARPRKISSQSCRVV